MVKNEPEPYKWLRAHCCSFLLQVLRLRPLTSAESRADKGK